MTAKLWIVWAVVLIAQNFSFTAVSRARNSGSLRRHIYAGLASNATWFVSQIIAVGAFMNIITGKSGPVAAIAAGVFYTVFTMLGSVLAHSHALKTEKGKSAVGANSKYAQITKEEWAEVQSLLAL